MAFILSNSPSPCQTTKKAAINKFPENPKPLILECKSPKELKQLHAHLLKTRRIHHPTETEPLLESAALLLPNPDIDYAASIFRRVENPQPSAYNVMIRGFTKHQSPDKSILLFRQMVEHLVYPNRYTFAAVLKACAKVRGLKEGEQIHTWIAKFGCGGFAGNGLVYMYACCGELEMARKVFDEMPERSVFAWNSMFSGYVRSGHWGEVVRLFREMIESGVEFDHVTLISVSKACGMIVEFELGEWIFEHVMMNGLLENGVLVTCLIDMYAKWGRVDAARRLFDEMQVRDVVAWSAIIAGYGRLNRYKEALDLFRHMQAMNVEPNEVTMVSVLSCCAVVGALETGRWVHAYVRRRGLRISVGLGTALVDFYAKCGCVDEAVEVFQGLPLRNVWTWTALIQGLASNGRGRSSIEYFKLMQLQDIEPNEVTFIGVLGACNHSGLVDEGKGYLSSMSRDFRVEPRIEHYGCVVDMLSRVGLIEEAYEFIKSMPVKPNAVAWRTLLAGCRAHKHVEIGEESLKHVAALAPLHSGDYILLSNIYASVGRLDDARRLRNEMKKLGIKKSHPGWSYIEVNGEVHEFLAEDNRHPKSLDIYNAVENMMNRIKLAGHVPDSQQARLEAEEDDDREASVAHHSEKLAVAFGLIGTSPGSTIRVTKNLRICRDCHSAAKVVSKVFGREIVIRDRNRFHHFRDGSCSCGNFW